MSASTDKSSPEYLARQYANDANLAKRIRLHTYTNRKGGWFRFLFPLYRLKPGMKVLEVGCGNSLLWRENRDRIPIDCDITLTDRSAGMYEGHRADLEALGLKLATASAEDLPFPDATFDLVIANHMLYHVPQLPKALAELKRVLKPDGVFTATTISRTNNGPLRRLVRRFDLPVAIDTPGLAARFGAESGGRILRKAFSAVERRKFRSILRVPLAEVVLDYLESMRHPGAPWSPEAARRSLEVHLARQGVFIVRNLSAVFFCRKG